MKKSLNIIPYKHKLVERAKYLRNNSTPAEKLLWTKLKKKQMYGYVFHRQKPIDNYIVDFFCRELMLAIEIDGFSHDGKYEYDRKRQRRLESLGIHVIRFLEKEVIKDLDNVLRHIDGWITENAEPTPTPPNRGNSSPDS